MRPILPVWLITALFVFASLASAQEKGVELKITAELSVSVPPGWRLVNQTRDSIQIHVPLQKERKQPSAPDDIKPNFVVPSEAGMLITIEHRRDHSEAVRRLAEIASEYPERASLLLIAGWPAIERRYRTLMPQPGESEEPSDVTQTSFATTAIAVGPTVIRFNTMLAPEADPKLLDQALAIARELRAPQGPAEVSGRELEEIRKMVKPPRDTSVPLPQQPKPGRVGEVPAPRLKVAGAAVQVQSGAGELEVATNDGQNVVIAANSGYSFSKDFGATWTFGGGTPCNQAVCDGDPSLAVGSSGAFYYAWIGGANGTALSDGVSRSTNNGQTFAFSGLAATCPGTTNCTLADQEHIAADRNNPAAGGGDQVYNVWRDFAPTGSIRISCSTDNGINWTAGEAIGSGDFPRVSVGGDGFVYVAWASGANMMLHRYSDCNSGLTPELGWPITVAQFTNVVCPVPGLDRCNGRNILSSPTVAVDDLDPTHIYYAFATSTGAGNEDVMVYDSSNSGATFPRSARVNGAITARRFMPWISTCDGNALVSWYDRRNATAANNDLTRYFIGGAAVKGSNLVALPEIDLSGADDNQCSTWLGATNAVMDSESCSVQPQLAGRCSVQTNIACDFSTPNCPAGQTCNIGRGFPKYGDYNGNAVGAGRLHSAWSSSVPPASVGGSGGSIKIYASTDLIPKLWDWNHNDLTTAAGGPGVVGSPAGYTWDVDKTQHVVYRGADGHIHELWFSSSTWSWNHNDLTIAAGGPGVASDPAGYTWDVDKTQHVVYRGTDGHIHELWFSSSTWSWNHNDLTIAAGGPGVVGNPAGYTWDVDKTQHVVYRGTDGHIHELWFSSSTWSWNHNDLTIAAGGPGVVGSPAGYTWDVDKTQHVVYRGTDGHIHELWFSSSTWSWNHNDLTIAAGSPSVASDPAGYTWDVDKTQHVVYRGTDNHIHELWFSSSTWSWNHNDLTIAAGGPSVASDPAGYTWDIDRTQHVVHRGSDGHMHELWFSSNTWSWNHNDLTISAGSTGAADMVVDNPAGYTWDIDKTQHVVYRGTNRHIHELWFSLSPPTCPVF